MRRRRCAAFIVLLFDNTNAPYYTNYGNMEKLKLLSEKLEMLYDSMKGRENMRLNKYLSDIGYCSRRKADGLIEAGAVKVNGELATLGLRVTDEDHIEVNGKRVRRQAKENLYIALNKPVGVECTANPDVRNNVVDYVGLKERVYPVGRLDKNSEGLILLTNDGEFADFVMRAANHHEKEYIVKVNRTFNNAFLEKMGDGVDLDGRTTRPCEVEGISARTFRIVLTQGMNRQIRRMCQALGYEVVKLKRIRVMSLELKDLPKGKWRYLTEKEVSEIKNY